MNALFDINGQPATSLPTYSVFVTAPERYPATNLLVTGSYSTHPLNVPTTPVESTLGSTLRENDPL